MLQLISFIEVEQCTYNNALPLGPVNRASIFYITSFKEITISKGIEDIIQTATIKLPRRFLINQYKKFPSGNRGIELNGTGSNIWSDAADLDIINYKFTEQDLYQQNHFAKYPTGVPASDYQTQPIGSPVFQMGDMVTIYLGYLIEGDPKPVRIHQQFRGYISSINAGEEIELHLEDMMWYLKQLRIESRYYQLSSSVNSSNYYQKGVQLSYAGLDNNYIDNSHAINTPNNYNYKLGNYPEDENLNPQTYSINTTQGILFDVLNKTLNDLILQNRGIWPLAWKRNSNNIPKPAICISGQPIQSSANIPNENNTSVFTMLEHLKNNYGLNIYFWQQSPAYYLTLDTTQGGTDNNNIPYHNLFGIESQAAWPCHYLNIGYDAYLPWSGNNPIYSPQIYNINLNGIDGNVIANNLVWNRADERPQGAIVKSSGKSQKAIKTKTGSSKKKTVGCSIKIGDISGSMKTILHSTGIDLKPDGSLNISSGDIDSTGKIIAGPLYQMAKYGYSKLNESWFTGYYGSINIMGIPFIYPGDIVFITDNNYPERDGYYKIKKVVIHCDPSSGLTQELFLHYLIDNTTGKVRYNNIDINTGGYYGGLNNAPVYVLTDISDPQNPIYKKYTIDL